MFLDRIVTQTLLDLEQRKRALPVEEMQRLAVIQPAPRDLLEALRPSGSKPAVRLIAEVKRASPSKGLLAPELDPVALARTYVANGAAAISVLTEPHFFLGSPDYLTAIKQAVAVPVLRKDFIVDEYQVYEARAWGTDAILLICAILDDAQLHNLLRVAHAQRMRCLVEVHNAEEALRAIAAGAVIIGVNSRDLVTFEMKPQLIRELRPLIPPDRVVVAESGIHSAADARRLALHDVQAMLVGESLVKASDVPAQMRSLLQGANVDVQVKICGLRTREHMDAAIAAGADMLGFMFYEPSSRYIQPQQLASMLESMDFTSSARSGQPMPELVGVFVNADAEYINDIADQVGLNIVQLHGNETPEFCRRMRRPVFKALQMQSSADMDLVQAYRKAAWRILLDTPTPTWGGTGVTHDWELARTVAQQTPIVLAGGLNPANVAAAIAQVQPWGVDVSSGVETRKQKDVARIQAFIAQARKTALEA
ncbi:MAG: bifunctional indole-3-glycerol-phosphate synthase TrpC/phosphoribosylanthranilate isomerase TrpF [Ktedonobacteraceae bacterium]